MGIKIIILGRAAVGKTSIAKVVFEGIDATKLLNNPLSPTRGIEINNYKWMDLDLGLFDLSGQEIDSILEEETKCPSTFENTDAFIYVLDYSKWDANHNQYTKDLHKLFDIIIQQAPNSKLIVFLHKIDIVASKKKINSKTLKKTISDTLNLPIEPIIYITSINQDYLYCLYESIFSILVSFSEHTSKLKAIIDGILKKYRNIFCLILNKLGSIIVQSMTPGFNQGFIRNTYQGISRQSNVSEKNISTAIKMKSVEGVSMISEVFNDETEVHHPLVKKIIYVFEDMTENQIRSLMEKIGKKISSYYLKWAENLFL
ncbi:MAG: ADP-ribosylation factor-like protein [Promethearchaeota archaeon]